MPVSLGGPDILVGNITDGKLVIKDIQYVPTTQLPSTTPGSGPAPIIQPPALTPINPAINLNTPAVANERLVLFNRQTNEYLSTTPELGKEAISKNPNIEFIAAFDSATADIVAKTLAENPPGNIDQMIMSEGGKNDIAGNMQVLAFLNALIVSLGNRGGILSELLSSGRISPELNIYQMYDLAKGINDFESIYVPDAPEVVVTQPPIRTTKAIGEEAPPTTAVPSPITTLALGEETPPDRQIMDLIYCIGGEGTYDGIDTYYVSNARRGCKINDKGEAKPYGRVISKLEYDQGIRQSPRPPFSWPTSPSGSLQPSLEIPGYPVNTPWEIPPMQSTIPSNCVKVPPGVPPVPAGCVPVRPPLPPQKLPPIIFPPREPRPPREKYDDTGQGTGTI